jgi:hypothetical protein
VTLVQHKQTRELQRTLYAVRPTQGASRQTDRCRVSFCQGHTRGIDSHDRAWVSAPANKPLYYLLKTGRTDFYGPSAGPHRQRQCTSHCITFFNRIQTEDRTCSCALAAGLAL